MTRPALLVATAFLLSACMTPIAGTPVAMSPAPVLPPGEAGKPPGPYVPIGQVDSNAAAGKSASFDSRRVVGPNIDLVRNEKGDWIGSAGAIERDFVLAVKDGEMRGAGVNVSILRQDDGTIYAGGLFFQTRYEVYYGRTKLKGNTHNGRCGFELKLVAPGVYNGDVGCGMQVSDLTIRFTGEAARFDGMAMPQVVLALLAVLP
jgi:hypothetical protein